MFFDLAVITAIGFILELFFVKFSGVVFNFPAYAGISLLIVFLCVTRWGAWGLLTAPFMALAVLLGGMNMDYFYYFSTMYDWRVYVAVLSGLLTMAINLVIYKKFGTKKILSSVWVMFLVMLINYALMCAIQMLVYGLTTIGASEDWLVIKATVGDELRVYYRRDLGENTFLCNLFGLAVLMVGGVILRSQGVLCNAKEKLIDDKRNADLDREFEKFSIEESDCEDASGETESQNNDESEGE